MLNDPANLFQAFTQAYEKHKTKELISYKDNQGYCGLTYQNIYERIIKLSEILNQHGINKNDNVAIVLENTYYWPIAFFSLMHRGAVAVPLAPNMEKQELEYCLSHAQVKTILTSCNLSKQLENIAQSLNIKIICLDLENLTQPLNQPILQTESLANDIAMILYTSGTTAKPKGVMLTHKNFLADVDSMQKLKLITENDCVAAILPFYHTYAFTVTLLLPFLTGAKVSLVERLDFKEITECVKKTNVTILVGVPRLFEIFHNKINEKIKDMPGLQKLIFNAFLNIASILRRFIKVNSAKLIFYKLHNQFGKNFKYMISGGAKLSPKIAETFYKWGLTILEGYGLTETSPVVSFNTPDNCRIGTVGKPIPLVTISIDNPDENGIGEIKIKGGNVTAGYYKDEELNRQAIRDGWFFTNDLGRFDEKGFLAIEGRKNEMIALSSGKKVNPQDLETRYQQSRFIKEICIFAVTEGAANSSSHLEALILPDYEALSQQKIIQVKERIRWEVEFVSQNLPSYKRIYKYKIAKEKIPTTILGKIKRYQALEIYKNITEEKPQTTQASPQEQELLSPPACKKAYDYICEKAGRIVNLDEHLELDLGFDSLEQIGLFMEFRQVTGIEISEDELSGIYTVKDVLKTLKRIAPQLSVVENKQPQEANALVIPQTAPDGIILNQPLHIKIYCWFFVCTLKIISKTFFFLSVKGKENIPKKGPFILCPNHVSYLDGPLLAASLDFRLILETHFLGFSAIFDSPAVAWGKKIFRLISIDPTSHFNESLSACGYVLKNGKALCMFPEGMRSINGEIKEFKRGVGILIKELDVPAIPVYIHGTYQAWLPNKKLPRPYKVTIIFGKPISAKELEKHEGIDIYKNIVYNLREEVIKLRDSFPG